MKISEVVEKVDRFQPNVFDTADKVYWCYECTRNILNECPVYRTFECVAVCDGFVLPLPVGVAVKDIAALFVNGAKKTLTDATDYLDEEFKKGDKISVVYRVVPDEYDAESEDFAEIETVVSAPFESMYIDYVCAQIAFQQNDAVEFNKFIGSFNDKLTSYKEFCGSNHPASAPGKFYNYF